MTAADLPSKNHQDSDLRHQLLRLVRRKKRCGMEELLQGCASYTWNQVFLEIDRLTRTGELRLDHKKAGDYVVSLPRAA
jgi:hypothetical protein